MSRRQVTTRYTYRVSSSHPSDGHYDYLKPSKHGQLHSVLLSEARRSKHSPHTQTSGDLLYEGGMRPLGSRASELSTYAVRQRHHKGDSESDHGGSIIYTPPKTRIRPPQPPRMSIQSFERATDIHIKGIHRIVQCQSETDYMMHAFSRALHQTFLPKLTTADHDWHLYHINFTPSRDGTDYKTYFHSTGPLDTKGLGNIRQLLESYDYGEEPGYKCINNLVDAIKSTDIPFERAMSFKEKNDCLTRLESAARTTCRKLSLLKDRIQVESLVCVCPEEYYVDGVERRPSYNVWVTVDPTVYRKI